MKEFRYQYIIIYVLLGLIRGEIRREKREIYYILHHRLLLHISLAFFIFKENSEYQCLRQNEKKCV